jgi:hypothetical protein
MSASGAAIVNEGNAQLRNVRIYTREGGNQGSLIYNGPASELLVNGLIEILNEQ